MDPELHAYLDAFRAEVHRDIAEATASARDETRRDLAEAIAASREETRRDLASAREETAHDLAKAIAAADERNRDALAQAMATLRAEIRAEGAQTRRHFDVVAEGLRGDIRLVAEGVVANTESIERLRSDVNREMDERFRVVHLAFADVRRDIAGLRARS